MFLRDANDVGGGRRDACADGDPRVRYDGRRQYHMTPFLPQRSGNANEGFACPGARVVPVHGVALQASGSPGRVRWSISHCVAGPHARSARLINDRPYRNTRPSPAGISRTHRQKRAMRTAGSRERASAGDLSTLRPPQHPRHPSPTPQPPTNGHAAQTKNPRALQFSRVFQTFIETHRSDRGAGDRTRTGKPVKAADFRHTASFKAGIA